MNNEGKAESIVIRHGLITYGERWFAEAPGRVGETGPYVDISRSVQVDQPVDGATVELFYTVLLDLRESQDRLFGLITRGCRYEIRRAEAKEGLTYHYWSEGKIPVLEEFFAFFDVFAKSKGLPPIARQRYHAYNAQRVLDLSCVKKEGRPLAWHSYYRDPNRVRLFHSASVRLLSDSSAMANAVGRANRFQHWMDILRFKGEGILAYDFGGWYHGDTDQEKLRINKFKEEFGGKVVLNYNCEKPCTALGHMYTRLRCWRNWCRRWWRGGENLSAEAKDGSEPAGAIGRSAPHLRD
jgi:hypothetical protein